MTELNCTMTDEQMEKFAAFMVPFIYKGIYLEGISTRKLVRLAERLLFNHVPMYTASELVLMEAIERLKDKAHAEELVSKISKELDRKIPDFRKRKPQRSEPVKPQAVPDKKLIARVDEHLRREELFKYPNVNPESTDPLDQLYYYVQLAKNALYAGNEVVGMDALNCATDKIAEMR